MVLMTLAMSSPLSAHVVGQIKDACNRSSTEARPAKDACQVIWSIASAERCTLAMPVNCLAADEVQ